MLSYPGEVQIIFMCTSGLLLATPKFHNFEDEVLLFAM